MCVRSNMEAPVFVSLRINRKGMEQEMIEAKRKLFLGGDRTQQIGWVEVYNGVNVIQYTVDKNTIQGGRDFIILPIGNSLVEECFGAFERGKHQMPF
jgi:hypothetical protein